MKLSEMIAERKTRVLIKEVYDEMSKWQDYAEWLEDILEGEGGNADRDHK